LLAAAGPIRNRARAISRRQLLIPGGGWARAATLRSRPETGVTKHYTGRRSSFSSRRRERAQSNNRSVDLPRAIIHHMRRKKWNWFIPPGSGRLRGTVSIGTFGGPKVTASNVGPAGGTWYLIRNRGSVFCRWRRHEGRYRRLNSVERQTSTYNGRQHRSTVQPKTRNNQHRHRALAVHGHILINFDGGSASSTSAVTGSARMAQPAANTWQKLIKRHPPNANVVSVHIRPVAKQTEHPLCRRAK